MASARRQRSHLPSPPASPSQQTPRPLPLPTEITRYKTWQVARSTSMNIKGVPVPPPARRSATAPVIGTTSDQFTQYDRGSSPEPEPEPVPKSVVEPEVPSRYTTSYYHILGLPESPDVTTKEIEEAYQSLVSNPSSHPSHSYESLERIRKTLTSSIRRRTYDQGRHAHLLHQSQLRDRERFEKLYNDCDNLSKAHKTTAQNIKAFTDDMRMKRLEIDLRLMKKEVAETVKRKVKVVGLSLSLDGLNEEEGIPWEETDFGTKNSELVGERLGLEFEFNGSGSEDDSGDENGSAGTFSDREQETKEPRRLEESEQITRLEKFEELSVSAMTGQFPKITSTFELEKAPIAPEMIPDDLEGLYVKDEKLSASEEAAPCTQVYSSMVEIISSLAETISKSDKEKLVLKDKNEKVLNIPKKTPEIMPQFESNEESVKTENETQEITKTLKISTNTTPKTSQPSTNPDLPMLTVVELAYPIPPPAPKTKTRKKKKKNFYKEIWEFDYNSDSECDFVYDSDPDPDTELSPEEPAIPSSSPPPTKTSSLTPSPVPIPTPKPHELPSPEIWEFDYPNNNTSSPAMTKEQQENEEHHETIILFLQLLIVFSLATAAWGWFGGGWVLNLGLA